ncbi:response regulator [Planctomyces sp. SH-PL14]|uniref:response regulator n=1 Tax=Planctomyces sp. SH-PL14 TaxID=1632864 RepID=UPI00078E2CF2|nr:response regulator [Planctomyces sp. SH-PL14]AMV20151.1 Response regulator receiver protein [Planctomyces sp. SH-PL14]
MRNRPSILVVDDELDICQNLADILADQDYDVDIASSGQAALDCAARKSYDVALLDLKMPEMDGIALYRKLREIRPEIVAIILTAYASDPTIRSAVHLGAWRVLPKPVDLFRLFSLLGDAVKQPLVLVVDDDRALCENLWDLFREWNLRVCVAHTEPEALCRIHERAYQVVLVDLKLPEGDGRNLIGQVHVTRPDARTILITAHAESVGDATTDTRPPDAVCLKPFDLERLRTTIARLTASPPREE